MIVHFFKNLESNLSKLIHYSSNLAVEQTRSICSVEAPLNAQLIADLNDFPTTAPCQSPNTLTIFLQQHRARAQMF